MTNNCWGCQFMSSIYKLNARLVSLVGLQGIKLTNRYQALIGKHIGINLKFVLEEREKEQQGRIYPTRYRDTHKSAKIRTKDE